MPKEIKADLRNIIDRSLLHRMAGTRSFERGEDYFERGHVRSLVEHNGVVAAKVIGQQEYSVRLWANGNSLDASCTCPMYASREFCKHCVAVGLAVIEARKSDKAESGVPVVKMDDVCEFLLNQEKETLVEMVLGQAMSDDRLRERLLLKAAGAKGKAPDLSVYRRAIDDAACADDFVDYRSMPDYASNIEAVVESVRELLEEGYAAEVIELAEYFLTVVEGSMGMVDDSDGYMGSILDSLQALHHEACLLSNPDPGQLARRLFQWGLQDKWDVFLGAGQRYADVLGDSGLAIYRQLAEAQWAQVPALGPGDDSSLDGVRWRINHIMETLARASGDVEALVQVMSRDLSRPYSYLEIAETYQQARQMDKAIQWAEQGLKAFPDRQDSRLRVFLAEAYHELGRHGEAMELMWAEFVASLRLREYQALKAHADKTGEWHRWRPKALDFIRAYLDRERKNDREYRLGWIRADYSELVRILLWEGNIEDAWREAQEGGCSTDLWLDLAKRREVDHPEESLRVYQAQIDPIVEHKTNDAYEEAMELMQRVGRIMESLGQEREFLEYIERTKAQHRRKRNFMKLVEQVR